MKLSRFILLSIPTLMLLGSPDAPAQREEGVPLILDERPDPQITVRTRPRQDTRQQPSQQQIQDAEKPDPNDIIVAIVNSRALTRAELDARVASRYEDVRSRVASQIGGIVANVSFGNNPNDLLTAIGSEEEAEILEEQKVKIEEAMRREEEEALNDWVIHSMLSDEARRQGIVIEDSVFKRRLAEEEAANNITRDRLEETLSSMQLSSADYQRSVYDALLIEALLDRYISVNYSVDELRRRYDANPALFREPAGYQIAHYTITFTGNENSAQIKSARERADKVRRELAAGADPVELFSRPEFDQITLGYSGGISGYHTFHEGQMPPVVEHTGRSMKAGETSRVLENQVRTSNGRVRTRSLHVIRILDYKPATGDTFESAQPAIRRVLLEISKQRLSERLFEARTHRVITNLSGIRPALIPTPEDIMVHEARSQPISLVAPRSS